MILDKFIKNFELLWVKVDTKASTKLRFFVLFSYHEECHFDVGYAEGVAFVV